MILPKGIDGLESCPIAHIHDFLPGVRLSHVAELTFLIHDIVGRKCLALEIVIGKRSNLVDTNIIGHGLFCEHERAPRKQSIVYLFYDFLARGVGHKL